MRKLTIWALSIVMAGLTIGASAQDKPSKKDRKSKNKTATEPKKEEDKFGDLIKKCRKSEGLFNLYRDTVSGKTYLEVKSDQWDKEYIYFNHIANAPVEVGYFRGSYGGSKVFTVRRNFDKVDLIQSNTNFYFDPNNAISKSADANINHPILASEKIEATSKDKKSVLIDADAIFLSEKFQLIKWPTPPGGTPGPLGTLSGSKSRVESIRNYPENTDVVVSYVYENSSPNMGSDALEDARNITIRYQHSILAAPQNDFKPRADDARIGYFSTQVNDMTSFGATPWRDVIHRWNLVKKNPGAELSEPVEPITYWIENTTPVEFRAIIKEACERWNIAFQKAGFINAVVCKEQPDDATWDAGDIRYNVLRWTSSPQPPFGGYGPSFVNPRTGQILGADIMLELVAIINRVNAEKVFKSTGYLQDEELEKLEQLFGHDEHFCMAGAMTNHNMCFASTAAKALSAGDAVQMEVAKQLLYRLVLHEVGHTLGLTHNMRASTMLSPAEVKDLNKVKEDGLSNSVMEYPAFNYQANPKEQSLYCDVSPGPYDLWVIEYGYSEAAATPQAETDRLKKITSRSIDPKLAYGNDADDMRNSGRGIDPDVNIYDLTNDPVTYAAERCDLVNSILPKMRENNAPAGQSYHELLQSYLIATGEYAIQLRVMTRQIGGVHYDRSFNGQNTTKKPLEPVSEEKQKAAMASLAKYAFAPDAFKAATPLLNYLLEQRRGFSHFSNNEDPHMHDRILGMQEECLNHLLHPVVLQRITDSQLYGNTYTLDEMFTELTNAIFMADAKSSVNSIRQNIQLEYVKRLTSMLGEKSKYDNVSQSMAIFELKRIDTMEAGAASPDTLTKAHREHVRTLIKQAMEGK
jgi:hypothetical protein